MSDAAVLQRLEALERENKKHDHALFGNGRPGLIQDMAQVKTSVEFIRAAIENQGRVTETVRKDHTQFMQEMQRFMIRMRSAVEGMERDSSSLSKRMKDLEAVITPIVDWKKGIIIRLTTTAAVLSAVVAALIFLFENWASVRAIF